MTPRTMQTIEEDGMLRTAYVDWVLSPPRGAAATDAPTVDFDTGTHQIDEDRKPRTARTAQRC